MSMLTQICRTSDGLELVELADSSVDMRHYRRQARQLTDRVRTQPTHPGEKSKVHVPSDLGPYFYLFVISNGLSFMTLSRQNYSKKLAVAYLGEVEKEFTKLHDSDELEEATVPFAFQSFESNIQKILTAYEDSNSQRSTDQMSKVQSELEDVNRILSQNIQDIIDRGDKIANVSQKTEDLFAESLKYEKKAKHLNWMHLWRKYGMYASVGALITFVLYFRFYFF